MERKWKGNDNRNGNGNGNCNGREGPNIQHLLIVIIVFIVIFIVIFKIVQREDCVCPLKNKIRAGGTSTNNTGFEIKFGYNNQSCQCVPAQINSTTTYPTETACNAAIGKFSCINDYGRCTPLSLSSNVGYYCTASLINRYPC